MNKFSELYKFLFLYYKYKLNLKILNIKSIEINNEFENMVFIKLLINKFKIHKSIINKIKTHNIKISVGKLHVFKNDFSCIKTNFECIFLCNNCNCKFTCNIYPDSGEIYSFDNYELLTCNEQIVKKLLE